MDVLAAILVDFDTLISALNLYPTVIRKGAKKNPTDAPTQITIAKSEEGETKVNIAFGHMATIWPIEIQLIAPNNGDYLTNLTAYTAARQAIAKLFGPPYRKPLLPTTPGCYNLKIVPDSFLPRDDMANNVDRWTLKIHVYTSE